MLQLVMVVILDVLRITGFILTSVTLLPNVCILELCLPLMPILVIRMRKQICGTESMILQEHKLLGLCGSIPPPLPVRLVSLQIIHKRLTVQILAE